MDWRGQNFASTVVQRCKGLESAEGSPTTKLSGTPRLLCSALLCFKAGRRVNSTASGGVGGEADDCICTNVTRGGQIPVAALRGGQEGGLECDSKIGNVT
jgi:hypothetical protein